LILMNDNEIQKLAAMASALRPDWHAKSLRSFIEKNLSSRTYADCAVAFAWICTHTKTETPRLILEAGAWWKAAGVENTSPARQPKRAEACADCGRSPVDHHGTWIGDHPFVPLSQAAARRSPDGAARVRAELAKKGTT
jgi:hypothetical protein